LGHVRRLAKNIVGIVDSAAKGNVFLLYGLDSVLKREVHIISSVEQLARFIMALPNFVTAPIPDVIAVLILLVSSRR